jgi:hypothetical protein
VVNRYVGNLAPMPGVFPDYLALVIRNTDTAPHSDDALGHAAAAHRRAASPTFATRPHRTGAAA